MTTTTAHFNRSKLSGFTLVELLVALALVSIIFAALFSSWGFIARSTLGIASYNDMNIIGRHGLETFARDVRMARDIENFSSTGMTLIMEDNDGIDHIYYSYDPDTQEVIRSRGDQRTAIFTDVDEIAFTRLTILRTAATNNLETKLIQLELRMVRPVRSLDTTQKIVSARYIMRNKRVAT